MTDFNPLASSILGSVQQQRQLAIEKSRRARRAQVLQKNIAAEDEQIEHEVESPDALRALGDATQQQHRERHRRGGPHPFDKETGGLDITG